MNYSELIQLLDQATAFDLYRLRAALDNMIDDPKRLIEVKAALRLGQQVQFYDTASNQIHEVIVERIKQTRAHVRHCESNSRWDIPLCAINVRGVDTSISEQQKQGLTKNELHVGEVVGFVDRSGIERSGKVIRLNQKSVTIDDHSGGSWRVGYSLLHKVINIDAS